MCTITNDNPSESKTVHLQLFDDPTGRWLGLPKYGLGIGSPLVAGPQYTWVVTPEDKPDGPTYTLVLTFLHNSSQDTHTRAVLLL
jgi:hypothetical protein